MFFFADSMWCWNGPRREWFCGWPGYPHSMEFANRFCGGEFAVVFFRSDMEGVAAGVVFRRG